MRTNAFVDQLYIRFLGRSADAAGRNFWSNLLDSGQVNAAQATAAFIGGEEFAGVATPIARLYYAAFGRVPDAAGLNFWMAQFKKGASLATIAADFMRSTEFQTLYGKTVTDAALVDLLYKNVLGRAADAEGRTYWITRLSTDKVPRAAVLNAFAESKELQDSKNEEIKIIIQYQSIAAITPSKTEIAAALSQNDPVALITSLYASATYSGVSVPYLNQRGVVVDGYIRNATLFVDRNGNHIQDNQEISIRSDIQGSFQFKGVENFNGVLVSQGGIDISTMRENRLSYTAPAGSSVISPISTLIEKIAASQRISLEQAQTLLSLRLELPAQINFLEFDPIAQSVRNGASADDISAALRVHQMAAQVNVTAKLLMMALLATGITHDVQLASDSAFNAITRLLVRENELTPLDFSADATIRELLGTAALFASADTPGLALIAQIQEQFASLVVNLIQVLMPAMGNDAMNALLLVAQLQYVADQVARLLLTDVADGDLTPSLTLTLSPNLEQALYDSTVNLGQLIQDIQPPTLQSSTPADNAGGVLTTSNIVLKFSEKIFPGSGNIVISDGKDIRTIPVNDTNQVSFHADTVTINPSLNLNGGTSYSVTMDSGVIKDRVGLAFAGITDKTTLNFQVPINVVKLGNLDGNTGTRHDGTAPAGIVSVSAAGDINGDGYADYIAGSSANTNTGVSYVVLGKAAAFAPNSKLSTLDGRTGVKIEGVTAEDFSGSAVAGLGDINGDGMSDMLIGAPGADPGGKAFAGSSYVVFGRKTFSATQKLSGLDGKTGFRIDAITAGDWSGGAVSSAGDVNADGLDDILIGANGSNLGSGAAYLIFGKAAGYTATLSLASLNGSTGTKMTSTGPNDSAGSALAGAGDVNGDGFADMLIGGLGANGGNGATWLVFGKANGFTANLDLSNMDGSNGMRIDGNDAEGLGRAVSGIGDINADGLDDFAIGAFHADGRAGAGYVIFGNREAYPATMNVTELDGKNGFKLLGEAAGNLAGISVSRAGDVNGDGLDDMLIGARDARAKAGSTYLVFGSREAFPAEFSLADMNGVNGMRLDGLVDDLSGGSVSAAGDVNGDGYDDLVIGAQYAQGGAGSTYLFFGGNFSSKVNLQGTNKADKLVGGTAADYIVGGQGDDVITTGGGADVIYAGHGSDTIEIADLDFTRINGGGGVDTLSFTGADMALLLADFKNKLESIEKINLLGNGNNSVTVTPLDALQMSSSTNTLTIIGDAGDTVYLSGNWTPNGTGKDGRSFSNGQAVVIVGVAITAEFI